MSVIDNSNVNEDSNGFKDDDCFDSNGNGNNDDGGGGDDDNHDARNRIVAVIIAVASGVLLDEVILGPFCCHCSAACSLGALGQWPSWSSATACGDTG